MATMTLPFGTASVYERTVLELFHEAGINVNGTEVHDIQVHHPGFYRRVLAQGSLGLGESYMDGWWDCPRLDIFFTRLLRVKLEQRVTNRIGIMLAALQARLLNFQLPGLARRNVAQHYNLGNDLFISMLDKRLTYTCGYWKNATTLDEAQDAKLDLTCRKLHMKEGMKVLDIGCGWGSFAKYATEKFAVEVTGITLSDEQLQLGRELCAGLPVKLKLLDYRSVEGKFDRIVSLGMFEHVGLKNYASYFDMVHRCLKDNGLFLLHTIGSNQGSVTTDPWLDKYIFPHTLTPGLDQVIKGVRGRLLLEDLHNFGADYDKTLMAWNQNFTLHFGDLRHHYSERFTRMWQYYLLCCAGIFRARKQQLWQMVFSKGISGGYVSVR